MADALDVSSREVVKDIQANAVESETLMSVDPSTTMHNGLTETPVACFSELHTYAAGFIIKGIQLANRGLGLNQLDYSQHALLTA